MPYTVVIPKSAKKELAALPRQIGERVVAAIRGLASEPRPDGCVKLAGLKDTYRLRVGDYRVVYDIHDRILQVLLLKVGHRRDVYRENA